MRSAPAKSSVANPISSGTICANIRSGVSNNSAAPAPAPMTDATIRPMNARLNGGSWERSESAASIVAGITEARFETAASWGDTPVAISAG